MAPSPPVAAPPVPDTANNNQDVDELEALLRQASQEQGDVLGILLHDSDVLGLYLARNGRVLDRYCSDPTYFGGETGEPRGHPALWEPLLGKHPLAALHRALKARGSGVLGILMWIIRKGRPDAHAVLAEVSTLRGIDPARARLGHKSLGDALLPDDVVLLFRLKQRPSWERESTAAPGLATEQVDLSGVDLPPEVLTHAQRVRVLPGRVGEPVELRALSWNRGRAFRGVRLLARIEGLPFDPRKVEVWTHRTAPAALAFTHEEGVLAASAPELAVAGALLDPLAEAGPGQMDAYVQARFRAQVGMVVEVIPQRSGRFDASLCVEPLDGGPAAEHRFVIEVV